MMQNTHTHTLSSRRICACACERVICPIICENPSCVDFSSHYNFSHATPILPKREEKIKKKEKKGRRKSTCHPLAGWSNVSSASAMADTEKGNEACTCKMRIVPSHFLHTARG